MTSTFTKAAKLINERNRFNCACAQRNSHSIDKF